VKPRYSSAYFGLEGDSGPTIEEIGEKYDLTKERIRQIKESVLSSACKRPATAMH
jgi:DNA-directed RNA polymerase sigma subunit (sigma70/sigma32)